MSAAHPAADKTIFETLPAAVMRAFDGTGLAAKMGFTVSLLTSDAAAHLQTSLLGPGEVFAPAPQIVRFALWPQARAARNLMHAPRCAMTFVLDGAFYQLQLKARAAPHPRDGQGLLFFAGELEQGEAQTVAYARLTSGISFDLAGDAAAVLARWQTQVEALKQLP